MPLTDYILMGALGLIFGFVGGYAGIGGAPFMIAALGLMLGYPQHAAQGTILAIMLFPMTLPGMFAMWDRIRPYLKYITIGVLTYAVLSYAGALLAYRFSDENLRLFFAGVVLISGILSIIRKERPAPATGGKSDGNSPLLTLNATTMTVLGCVIGVVGGFFGIGAGILMIPVLIWVFGLPKDDARAISLAILAPPVSVGAVIKYNAMNHVIWPMALAGLTGYMMSNYWGAKYGRTHSPRRFNTVMGALLIIIAALYIVQSR